MGLWKNIKRIFDRKCTFCGSRNNVRSCTVLTFLYYYCDRSECRIKMDRIRKRERL